MNDLTVDTNVLVQASDTESKYYDDCEAFLRALRTSTTSMCVDESLDANVSLILHEYFRHLQIGMVGFASVTLLASTGRLKAVSRAVSGTFSKRLRKLVPNNKRDRTFVRVAANSIDHVLVSHDFSDFPRRVRTNVRRNLEVTICTAAETITELVAS